MVGEIFKIYLSQMAKKVVKMHLNCPWLENLLKEVNCPLSTFMTLFLPTLVKTPPLLLYFTDCTHPPNLNSRLLRPPSMWQPRVI